MSNPRSDPHDEHQSDEQDRMWFTILRLPAVIVLVLAILLVIGIVVLG